jgi:hypothetical protein
MDELSAALTVLHGLLEAGFTDLDKLRAEPKLRNLRQCSEFDAVLAEVEPLSDDSTAGSALKRVCHTHGSRWEFAS